MKLPSKATLRRYGLTRPEWWSLYCQQNGSCAICESKSDKLVIDHEHVKGWKKMRPEVRVMYVRGLLCIRCNWKFLTRGMTFRIARNMADYLCGRDGTTP